MKEERTMSAQNLFRILDKVTQNIHMDRKKDTVENHKCLGKITYNMHFTLNLGW